MRTVGRTETEPGFVGEIVKSGGAHDTGGNGVVCVSSDGERHSVTPVCVLGSVQVLHMIILVPGRPFLPVGNDQSSRASSTVEGPDL